MTVRGERPLSGAAGWFLDTARRHRRLVAYSLYGFAGIASLGCAFLARFEGRIPAEYLESLPVLAIALTALRLAFARAFRLLTSRWRYVGVDDALRLGAASSLSSLTFLLLSRGVGVLPPVPISVVGVEWTAFTLFVGGSWLTYRRLAERLWARKSRGDRRHRRVVIVGAGEAGNLLVHEVKRRPLSYRIVGFLDDDPLKQGTRIQGVEVLGSTADAPEIFADLQVDEIIIAVPSATPQQLRSMLVRMQHMGIPFKVLPGVFSALEATPELSDLRPLRIEDLLGRDPVSLEIPALERDLAGETVLVTGAAGSIGSELARQLAANRPARVVLLDQAESDLYFLDLELRNRHPELPIVPVIADILDSERLTHVFGSFRPSRVYHAAAYKHVPLMERNPTEAIRNNVFGTLAVARTAGTTGARRFVLVSTDKAADPSSVMGATKRVAEIVVQALQQRYPATHYTAVRFGNVLGSNGSVVPLFQRQIASGGPITITDPEVSRYFMTIPEATRLVLQAGLLPEARGRIAMLEMGEPVKIMDLARNLVRLSGLEPDVDIKFVYTGLRPGEKLHESLVGEGEASQGTSLAGVRIVTRQQGQPSAQKLLAFLGEFQKSQLPGVRARELLQVFDWIGSLTMEPEEALRTLMDVHLHSTESDPKSAGQRINSSRPA